MNQFEDRVNQFFINEADGKIYRLQSYCSAPSITMVEVGAKPRSCMDDGHISVGVGGLISQGFKPLGKEESEMIEKAIEQMKNSGVKTFKGVGTKNG